MDSSIYSINDAMILCNFIDKRVAFLFLLAYHYIDYLTLVDLSLCFFSEFNGISRFHCTTAIQNLYLGLIDGLELLDTSQSHFYICLKESELNRSIISQAI